MDLVALEVLKLLTVICPQPAVHTSLLPRPRLLNRSLGSSSVPVHRLCSWVGDLPFLAGDLGLHDIESDWRIALS